MVDTQETNLPEKEENAEKETGKLEEPQATENSPVVTTTESEVKTEDTEVKVEKVGESVVESEETAEKIEETVDEHEMKVVKLIVTVDKLDATVEEVDAATGEVDATVGEVDATAGEVDATAGEVDATVGEVDATAGEVDATVGEVDATAGEVDATVGEVDATVGEVDATVGEVDATVGEVDATVGEVDATVGEVDATVGEVDATAGEVDATAGEVDATVGEVDATVGEVDATVGEVDATGVSEASSATESRDEAGNHAPLDAAGLAVITKSEIIERLKQIVAEPQKYAYNEADLLKQTYYKLRRAEIENKKNEFLEGGGEEKDFVMPEDETEPVLKSFLSEYKEKRVSMAAEEERLKESNYMLKQHLVERLKVLTESQDDFNKRYHEFREIQRKWKEIKLIPQEYARELWRNYQLYNERFYDIVKINNQFRDYDFKKNLELKTLLCETVERLDNETDIISAFHQLQKLHQQWREIGPVAKEFRDAIWERFKEASTLINKKHQAYFESMKAAEEKNLEEKKAICEKIEEIHFEALKTMKDWEKKTAEVIALQAKWRTIGFATKKQNVKIFERFRAACDHYFNKKGEFYKSVKQEMDKNLELKRALVEKAESMKNSTDWKETAKIFVELQNEWKKIGPVARKYSETVWKQFIAACDYFFEKKSGEMTSQKSEENENMDAKKTLIEKIRAIDDDLSSEDALLLLRNYISEWNKIGFVPFKEKDRLYKLFREVVDKQFDRLKVNERDRRIQQYRSNLTELSGTSKNKLYSERDKLMRVYEKMKNELQTYENNIGFFNISSKGGDGLVKEMDRKITRLREEMEVIVKKIEAIDENLE
jgi:methyl-accepting chemotaxis protein